MRPVGAVDRRSGTDDLLAGHEPRGCDRLVELEGIAPRIDGNFADDAADGIGRSVHREGFAERYRDDARRGRSEKLEVVRITVAAPPQSLNVERDDDRMRVLHRARIIQAERADVRRLS